MSSVRLTFLGTGTGEPSAGRSASGLAVSIGDRAVLIDAGDGVARNWLRYLGDIGRLKGIVLSHLHADHVSGLPYLIQGLHLSGREEPLDLYSPPETYPELSACLAMMRLAPDRLNFDINWRSLSEGDINLDDIFIRPFPNSHIKSGASGAHRSYSLLLNKDEHRALYSSDIGGLSDLDPALGRDPDLLIIEMTHFAPDDIFDYLRSRPPGRLVLTHVPEGVDPEAVVTLGRSAGFLDVAVAEDGMEVSWA